MILQRPATAAILDSIWGGKLDTHINIPEEERVESPIAPDWPIINPEMVINRLYLPRPNQRGQDSLLEV
jgi:hypothetical protein